MNKNFPISSESISALKYKKDHNIPSHIELRTSKQWKHIGHQVKKVASVNIDSEPLYTLMVEQESWSNLSLHKIKLKKYLKLSIENCPHRC